MTEFAWDVSEGGLSYVWRKKRETKGHQITFLLRSSNIIFLGKELTNKDSGSFRERSVSALQIMLAQNKSHLEDKPGINLKKANKF